MQNGTRRTFLLGAYALLAAAPVLAAPFTVTKTADTNDGACDADCSLREAIGAANGVPGPHTITFAIPGVGPHTITPLSNLPTISETMTIDGTTQPGYAGSPLIVVKGNPSVAQTGLRLGGAGNCTVRGLTLNGWIAGAIVVASNGELIADNFIGTDASGTVAAPNSDGVSLLAGASTITLRGNVISGNDTGIRGVNNSSVRILGNFIGTDRTGTQAVPNTTGILAHNVTNLQIGDGGVGNGNIVSGNGRGIVLDGFLNGGQIYGNRIGADVSGTLPLGNASHGITLDAAPFALIRIGLNTANAQDVSVAAAVLFQIGASTPNAPNVVAHNGGAGVWVVNGTGVLISSNSIHSNGGLGIDLGSLGVLANDTLDADLGANLGQNYPVITLATTSGGFTTIQGVLDSAPNRTYSVELFSDSVCNGAPPNDHGEGRNYLAAVQVQTDSGGHAVFQKVVPTVTMDAVVTATATDPDGNTSEFSPCQSVQGSATPTPTPGPPQPTPTPIDGPPDVAVSLTGEPDYSDPGAIVRFIARVVNNGPGMATNVGVRFSPSDGSIVGPCESVVAGTCIVGSLQPGQSTTVVLARNLGINLSQTVVVTHSETDRDSFNDTATANIVSVDCDDLDQECPIVGFIGTCICNIRHGGVCNFFSAKVQPVAAAVRLLPFEVNPFYGLRDKVFARTPEGRRYKRLYETHGPEILRLMLQDPLLFDEFVPALRLWQENLRALVADHGGQAVVTAEQVASLDAFLEHLKALGSAALRDTITREQAALDLPSKVGLTMDQALVAFQQPGCPDPETTLCLGAGRFRATVAWRDPQGRSGTGHARPLTADTGHFWFFSPENVELVVKVLDGRAINGEWWVFSGSLSNVEYTLTVTDTTTGAVRTYTNPPSHFGSFGDTAAFEGGPAGSPPSAAPPPVPSACDASGNRLCLNHRRFEVEVAWRDFDGNTGFGHAVDLTDDTGYFWFFSPENVELVVKALDGRSINGDFWIFYGALSNVEYTVTVRDRFTGQVRTYLNPSGTFASVGDTAAFAGLSANARGTLPPALDAWSLLLAACGVRLFRRRR